MITVDCLHPSHNDDHILTFTPSAAMIVHPSIHPSIRVARRGVAVHLNGARLPIANFVEYVGMYNCDGG